jgi:hypothetical protein
MDVRGRTGRGRDGGSTVGADAAEPPGPDGRTTLVLSYLGLRRCVGLIGMFLPFTLALGKLVVDGPGLEPSISDYYYTGMRDVLVGSLCAIAVFLFSYRYDRPDAVAGIVASLSALGAALFPTTPLTELPAALDWVGIVHLLCASTFFLTLAYFCLVLFPRTRADRPPTPRKRLRNVVYRACGGAMVVSIALIGVLVALPAQEWMIRVHAVFWLESVAIVAFGIAWFIKGETLLTD